MGEQAAARSKERRKRESVQERKHVGRRGLSSAGRAPALQAGGREFESLSLHEAQSQGRKKENWGVPGRKRKKKEGLIAQPVRAHA